MRSINTTKKTDEKVVKTKNRLDAIIKKNEEQTKQNFSPTLDFFKHIGIGRRRFRQIVRNEVSPTFSEMQILADYFGVHILELHESTVKYLD